MVSIVVPSYNHARFLDVTLSGVVNQTFEDWELLFLDDGSKDDSLDIASRYAENDPRIKVSRNPSNLGTYATLNRGIELATYEWISVLNSDDAWHPDKLALQVQALNQAPQCQYSYTAGKLIDEASNDMGLDHHRDYPTDTVQNPLAHLFDINQVLASSLVFRKSNLRFVSNLRYSGDWVGAIRLARASSAAFVNEPMTYWRQHGENASTKYAKVMPEEIWVRSWIQENGFSWLEAVDEIAKQKMGSGALILGTQLYLAKEVTLSRQFFRKAMSLGSEVTKRTAMKRFMASFLPRDKVVNRFSGQASHEDFDIIGLNYDELEK